MRFGTVRLGKELILKMKQINVYFDDEEYKKLLKEKDGLTWHDFILNSRRIKSRVKNEQRNKK